MTNSRDLTWMRWRIQSVLLISESTKMAYLLALAEALQISRVFTCRQHSIIDSMEGLCMPFWRLVYPSRYSYMMVRSGRPAPVLSMIANEVLDFINTNHGHRILQCNPVILKPVKLEEYANAIQIKGSALDNCFGFIDGTVRPISQSPDQEKINASSMTGTNVCMHWSFSLLRRQMAWLPICMDL